MNTRLYSTPALVSLFFFIITPTLFAQSCDPLTGTASAGSLEYTLNPLKNRTTAPTSGHIDHSITLDAVLAPGNDETRFHTSKGAVIEGWVIGTRMEGKESCNCNKPA